ncbi:MAG: tetratricopeptide repeat protein [Gemmatimonadota bacterium]
MPNERIAALTKMLERSPDDPRFHFGLAMEYEKLADWGAVAEQLTRYLELTEDQGNAWGRLGHALRQLGRDDEARAAYQRGIESARRHGHPSMAAEFEEVLADWG